MSKTSPTPPTLPVWFLALDTPRPLLGDQDDRWIVKARRADPADPEVGILIFEDHHEFVFLIDEEATNAARYIVQTQRPEGENECSFA